MIRTCQPSDAARICEIYNVYVRDTVITFEEEPVDEGDMARRIAEVTAAFPWFVWQEDGSIAGYAYAAPWKARTAYRHSVESTVYVDAKAARRGIGMRLYEALIAELRGIGVHCVVAGIALPNAPSVALHEKLGFTRIGQFGEIGWKFGRWVDVGYWQRLL
jgi:L-amino acid N-acyltransferase YncA